MHKPQNPLRPIDSCIGTPSYKLSKYIASVISPLAGRTSSHVLNSRNFTGTMKEECVEVDETLVCFDVTLLFTNVPTDETVEVIHKKLLKEEDLMERIPLSPERITALSEVHLLGEFYEQKQGAAMGSPVSAVVANFYVEELALESVPARPRLWKWCVEYMLHDAEICHRAFATPSR